MYANEVETKEKQKLKKLSTTYAHSLKALHFLQ